MDIVLLADNKVLAKTTTEALNKQIRKPCLQIEFLERVKQAEKVARARKICDFITECAIDIWNGDSNADSATFTVDITPTGAYCKVAHYTEKKF